MSERPPRVSELLLAACLPSGYRRDGALGDLHEEYCALAARDGARRARRWYRRQALTIGARQLMQRTGGKLPARRRNNDHNDPSLPANGGPHDRGRRRSVTMDWLTDLRVGLRGLRKQPGFTAVVVLTLAVGIGANGAIFSVVEQVLMQPLPYPDADRVLQVWGSNEAGGVPRWGASLHDFEDWRARSETLAEIGVYNTGAANLTYGELPERVSFAQVSPSVFGVLGVAPRLGRTFQENENLPGNDAVVVVSHEFWATVLGGRDDVVGSTVELDGTPMQIVGVMPEGFYFPGRTTGLWKPFGMRPDDSGDRGGRWVSAVGRLADGVSLEAAQQEMSAIAAELAAEYPDTNEGFGVFLERRSASVVRNSRPIVLAAWAVVGLVLLIACANVANLMLSRATTRAREMAVRASLGAGRGRLVRQLLTESLLLGAAGGATGALLATWLTALLSGLDQSGIARLDQVAVTWSVLAYTTVLSLLTTALFGLAPALRASRLDLSHGLRQGSAATGGAARRGARELLAATQLALSVIVLIGALLLLRTFWNLSQVELGFAVGGRVEAQVAPSWREIPDRAAAVALFERLSERLRGLPGVESVGAGNALPLVGANMWRTRLFTAETAALPPNQRASVCYRTVLGDYFQALDIDLVAGRYLERSDIDGAQPVVVVSRNAASTLWPSGDALDRELWLLPEDNPQHRRYRVVGIVEDVIDNAQTSAPSPLVYFSMPQAQWGHFQDWGMTFVVHGSGDPGALVEPVREALTQGGGGLPVFGTQTLADRLEGSLAGSRFNMLMIGCLGAVALLLASIGVYGVMAFTVARRTREIGTRVALGATRHQVVAMVVRRGVGLAAVGAAVGWIGAYASHGVIDGLLYGVEPADPLAYGGVAAVLLLVALLAAWVPARRAARIDPLVCLRDE